MGIMTFRNLPKEKQARIIAAGKKEFSRVPLHKALISNIIRDAKIPRGSFYQYFDGIEDLFMVVVDDIYGKEIKSLAQYLEKNNNDFYMALKEKFSDTIDKLSVQGNRQFNINMFKNFFFTENEDLLPGLEEMKMRIDERYLPEHFMRSQYSKEILSIIQMINVNCISRYLIKNEDKESVKRAYNRYLDSMKYAFHNLRGSRDGII